MACTPDVLVSDARCLVQGMSERQLLASIACQLAVAAGEECDADSLIASSKCLLTAGTGDRELLAMIVWLLCNGGCSPCEPCPPVTDSSFTLTPESIPMDDAAGVLITSDIAGLTGLEITASSLPQGLVVDNQSTLESITGASVTSITGDVDYNMAPPVGITLNPSLTSISLPALETLSTFTYITDNAALASLSLPALTTIGDSFYLTNNTSLTSVDLSSLTAVGNYFTCNNLPALPSLDLSSLTTAGDYFGVNSNALLSSLDLSSLTSAGDGFSIHSMPITSLDLSSLVTLGSGCGIKGTMMTSLDLSSLTTVGDTADFGGSIVLTSINLSSLSTVGNLMSFYGCSLDAANVNAVLARLVLANGSAWAGEVQLDGGSNAAPTGQGILDKATLIGRGATVTTN